MKHQPNRNYKSNDEIMTPLSLAEKIVGHFKPKGRVLEPCRGTGNFLRCLPRGTEWCEINSGRDFFDYKKKMDWIITNPPWSKIRAFLQHSLEISENIVFLMTINHIWTKARLRDIKEASFGIKEILLVETPKEFPPLGFQIGAVHLKKNYRGKIKINL